MLSLDVSCFGSASVPLCSSTFMWLWDFWVTTKLNSGYGCPFSPFIVYCRGCGPSPFYPHPHLAMCRNTEVADTWTMDVHAPIIWCNRIITVFIILFIWPIPIYPQTWWPERCPPPVGWHHRAVPQAALGQKHACSATRSDPKHGDRKSIIYIHIIYIHTYIYIIYIYIYIYMGWSDHSTPSSPWWITVFLSWIWSIEIGIVPEELGSLDNRSMVWDGMVQSHR